MKIYICKSTWEAEGRQWTDYTAFELESEVKSWAEGERSEGVISLEVREFEFESGKVIL